MQPTETSFTAAEICRIIKAIGEAKLTYFRLGSLVIRTSGDNIPQQIQDPVMVSAIEPRSEIPTQDTQPQGLSKKQDIEEQLDDLLLDDPKAYEDAVLRGALNETTD